MSFVLTLFTVLLFIFALYSVNYCKISTKSYIYIFTTILFLNLFFISKYEEYLLPIVILIMFIFLYIEIKSIHALIITCMAIVLLFVSNSTIGTLILSITNIPTVAVFRESQHIYILSCILGYIFVLLVGYPFRKFAINHIKNFSLNFKHKSYFYMVLLLVLTICIFYVTIVLFQFPNQKINETQLIMQVPFCVGYFILLFLIFNALIKSLRIEYETKLRDKQYEDIKEYAENLESLYNDMRAFRHDYINILSSMTAYIETKDIDGLSIYFNNHIVQINAQLEKRNSQLGRLQNIKIPEIKGLVFSKIVRAQELNIDVDIEVVEEIESININIVDLSRIFGILLDNAIEELKNCENKKIRFALIKKGTRVIILVCNECSDCVAPIFKIYDNGFSTKGPNRGLGLPNLKKILSLYPKITLETKIINNEFIQCIEI